MALRARRTRKAVEERLSTQLASDVSVREADLPCGWSREALQERFKAGKGWPRWREFPPSPAWLCTPEMEALHQEAILWDIRVTPNPYEDAYLAAWDAIAVGTATDDQKALVDEMDFEHGQAEADHWADYNLRRWGHRSGPRGAPE
jgi:hypothetical protein